MPHRTNPNIVYYVDFIKTFVYAALVIMQWLCPFSDAIRWHRQWLFKAKSM